MSGGRERYQALIRELAEHDHAYYVLARPRVSDAEYDRLFRELVELERTHPEWLRPDSPSQRVGAPLPEGSRFERVEHAVPMVSIESLFGDEEVQDFHDRVGRGLSEEASGWRYVCEPKWDGVSASLIYRDGLFARGVSRGDGAVGEDLSSNLRAVGGVPLRLRGEAPQLLEVRGEVLQPLTAFERVNRELVEAGESPFANPRNATAGTLKRLDPSVARARGLRLIAWELVRCEGGPEFATHTDAMAAVEEWGFPVTPYRAEVADFDGMKAFHDQLEEQRDAIDYEMDGVVVKVDRRDLRQRLGSRARTPRWACAYKFAPREEITRLLEIEIQVGRTGRLTPRARLEPVQLGGTTVQYATLHNAAYIEERDIRLGDWVVVRRAGDVIPQILAPVPERRDGAERAFVWPSACPECGAEAVQRGEFRSCVNLDCPAQMRRRAMHLASRKALRIEGLGERAVEQFAEAGILERVEDVFALDFDRIRELDGWGEKSAEELQKQIEAARRCPLEKFLFALGVPELGEEGSSSLAAGFGSLDAVLAGAALAPPVAASRRGPRGGRVLPAPLLARRRVRPRPRRADPAGPGPPLRQRRTAGRQAEPARLRAAAGGRCVRRFRRNCRHPGRPGRRSGRPLRALAGGVPGRPRRPRARAADRPRAHLRQRLRPGPLRARALPRQGGGSVPNGLLHPGPKPVSDRGDARCGRRGAGAGSRRRHCRRRRRLERPQLRAHGRPQPAAPRDRRRDPGRRWSRRRLGLEEDRLPGRRREGRLEAQEGRAAGRDRARRGRPPGPARGLSPGACSAAQRSQRPNNSNSATSGRWSLATRASFSLLAWMCSWPIGPRQKNLSSAPTGRVLG